MRDSVSVSAYVSLAPSGGRKDVLPLKREREQGREDGQSDKKKAEPVLLAPHSVRLIGGYAATFFVAFGCAFAAGLGAAFFAGFALSFSANSCLTLAAIASLSTL